MHVHSCLSIVEIPDLHVNPPCLRSSNCKYTPVLSDFLFKGPPLPSDSEKLSVVLYGYYLELPNLFIILGSKMQLIGIGYLLSNRCRQRGAREPGLEIISRESPDTLASQIHFSPVTYRQIYNS